MSGAGNTRQRVRRTLTALVVHLFWSYAARHNVADVAGQLNRQIVDSIHHELHGVLDDAWSMQEAVRSIFFQGTIKTSNEAKREFLFLALLRSQPSLSWISLGFPDGGFFGARKASDTEIDMIEVKWNAATRTARQRTDYYTPEIGDMIFTNRELEAGAYDATAQSWYRRPPRKMRRVGIVSPTSRAAIARPSARRRP
jgi:adenylate cyclase